MDTVIRFLDCIHTDPNYDVQYYTSDMILNVHPDALHLSADCENV